MRGKPLSLDRGNSDSTYCISSQRPPLRWSFYFWELFLFALCYIDEAGCTGILPFPTSPIQPVFVISALFIEQKHIIPITKEFLALKWKYFPGKFSGIVHDLDAMTVEIKGSDLRRDIRKGNRNERNHAYSFIDEVFDLLDKYQGWCKKSCVN